MGARFTSATPTYLLRGNGTVTGHPFCMGCWVYVVSAAVESHQTLAASGDSLHYYNNGMLSATQAFVTQISSTGANTAQSNILYTVGQWYFHMGRWVSSSSRWCIVFDPSTGRVDQVQNTTTTNPGAMTRLSLGVFSGLSLSNPSNNILAEAFITDADIPGAAAGTALPDELVRKIALEGIFSRYDLIGILLEYLSLRQSQGTSIPSESNVLGDYYFKYGGLQLWSNTTTAANVPVTDAHPPLTSSYVYPNARSVLLAV